MKKTVMIMKFYLFLKKTKKIFIVEEITEEGLKYDIHFLFSSTEIETGINALHKNFFSYIESLSTTDFDQIVDEIKSYDSLIPISDWYHILKDMRGRYGRNNIAM